MWNYVISFFIIMIVSSLSSLLTINTVKTEWYNCVKPKITPKPLVFSIMWTIIYVLLWILLSDYIKDPYENIYNLIILLISLLLNIIWCWGFFYKRQIKTSVIILVLIITTVICLIDKNNYIYLLPYLLWLCFALLINIMSMFKNCHQMDP